MHRLLIGLAFVSLALLANGAGAQDKGGSKAEKPTTAAKAEAAGPAKAPEAAAEPAKDLSKELHEAVDYSALLFVFVLATFIGLGVVARVSRLLHTPLMSLTNAISAIAIVGSIIVTGSDYPLIIRMMGAVALFASMTNVVSGFLITDRMLRMFKQTRTEGK